MGSDGEAAIERGRAWILRMLEVADAVDLERARALTDVRGARRGEARVRGPDKGAAGVVLATPPLDLDLAPREIDGFRVAVSVRIYDFGAVSVRFGLELPEGASCRDLARTAARIEQGAARFDDAAREAWHSVAGELRGALRGAHESDLVEDYTLWEVTRVAGCATAAEALEQLDPAAVLLGEPDRPVAEQVRRSHVERALSYYADDAAVIGWNAALVIDPRGSRDELEVLEIATARLLELRYYDGLLARELASVYAATEVARASTTLFRSPFVKVARRAATLFVEMTDLYDRVEGALTLVGDAYTARLYREAEARFRLAEISAGVRDKLATLSRVSEIFEGEISHRRSLVLEAAVLALIVVEVALSVFRSR